MLSIEVAYFLAAVAASGVFVAAGWRKTALTLVTMQGQQESLIDPAWSDAEADTHAPEAPADVGVAVCLALKRLSPIMSYQSVQADVATHPGLRVRMPGAVLTELLEDILAAAIRGAPASQLLLSTARRGNRIDVEITDDMPGADRVVRLGSVHGLIERVARRGGMLEVNVRPAEGTTMTLRLAAAAGA